MSNAFNGHKFANQKFFGPLLKLNFYFYCLLLRHPIQSNHQIQYTICGNFKFLAIIVHVIQPDDKRMSRQRSRKETFLQFGYRTLINYASTFSAHFNWWSMKTPVPNHHPSPLKRIKVQVISWRYIEKIFTNQHLKNKQQIKPPKYCYS